MPQHSFISIPLDIPDMRVWQTDLTKDGELILTVERTLTSSTCRRCGRTITDAPARSGRSPPPQRGPASIHPSPRLTCNPLHLTARLVIGAASPETGTEK